jgi:NADPH2:quinone reductase
VNMMRAVLMDGFGPIERLRTAQVPVPECRPQDLLIRVAAAGVNPVDWKECEGFLKPFYDSYGDTWVPGYDAAGVVAGVGTDAHGFKAGDRVVAFSDRRENGHNGTFAEYVRVLPNAVCKIPDAVTFEDAAALVTAGLTGYQALFRAEKGALKPADSVLIHGASGGVGSYAVQFARNAGLRIAATCSQKNVTYVRSLGADEVIDYAAGSIAERVRNWNSRGVDVVIDCVSGDSLPDALEALVVNGRLISIATLNQDGDIARQTDEAASRGFTKSFSIVDFSRIDQDLREMLELLANGRVKPPPTQAYPLERAPEALRQLKTGHVRGKVVLVTRPKD